MNKKFFIQPIFILAFCAVSLVTAIPQSAFADNINEVVSATQEDTTQEASLPSFERLSRVIFTPRYFEPHKIHFYDDPGLLWFLVSGNALIALSYVLIPIALIYLVRKRKDIIFTPIFFLFAAFIVLCGLTHLMHIMILWYPVYWLEAIILALTGVVSILTFFAFIKVLPNMLVLKSPKQLEKLNTTLSLEIENRKQAEEELKQQNQKFEIANKEILEKNEELERINKLIVGRETTMIELKKKIKEMENR